MVFPGSEQNPVLCGWADAVGLGPLTGAAAGRQ